MSSNSLFHISNTLTHISTHFFTHTYIKNTQNTLLKLSYQTGPKSSTNHHHNHDTTTSSKHQPNRSHNDQTQPTIEIHTMSIQNPHTRTHPKSHTHNPIKRDLKVEGRKGCRRGMRDNASRSAASYEESVKDNTASDR